MNKTLASELGVEACSSVARTQNLRVVTRTRWVLSSGLAGLCDCHRLPLRIGCWHFVILFVGVLLLFHDNPFRIPRGLTIAHLSSRRHPTQRRPWPLPRPGHHPIFWTQSFCPLVRVLLWFQPRFNQHSSPGLRFRVAARLEKTLRSPTTYPPINHRNHASFGFRQHSLSRVGAARSFLSHLYWSRPPLAKHHHLLHLVCRDSAWPPL